MPLARTANGKRLVVDNRALARRVNSLRTRDESTNAFARRTGVPVNQLRRLASKQPMGLGLGGVVRIARATGKSLDWLVLGK